MPLLQGLIFDLDGTLLDSAPDLRHAVNQTLRAHGRKPLPLEAITPMIGDGMMTLLSRAFAASGPAIPDSESYARFQEFITHYRNLPPDPSQIYPLGKETLEKFHAAGIKLGICTNKQEAATVQLLDQLGLKRYFTFIAGGDTFPVHKPHPGHVRGVIEKLEVPAANCVMIGDSSNDVASAHGAGIPCIVVTHGYGGGFGELDARALIGGFEELCGALKTLGFEVKLADIKG